ncbi:phosphoesterase [Limnochorda pilosa]|uniref:Phosphoesterase n=1 Tax=Limnochorda pilosa TaxID=1555112 RepID=A0A0K2SI17_LIMPI|nr:phosphoesterase [Limnochorda pilosa]
MDREPAGDGGPGSKPGGAPLAPGGAPAPGRGRAPGATDAAAAGTGRTPADPGPTLRILHLSDLHLRGLGGRERRVLRSAARLAPDLICLTGDLAEGARGHEALRAWAAQIASVAPTFAVLGDHDFLLQPADRARLEAALRRAGVHLLRNRSSWVSGPGWRVWVVGVDDARKGVADLARAMRGDAARAAQNGVPHQGSEVRLLLSHWPGTAPEAAEKGFHLVLAGDTHGGQVNLPWLGPVWAWMKERSPYLDGVYHLGGTWLHVSRGLGWSHLPVRFRCRPQVALLELPLGPVPVAEHPPETAVEPLAGPAVAGEPLAARTRRA